MILAGDIGGTKTNLAWFARNGDRLERLETHSFPSRDYPGLEPVLDAFLAIAPRPLSSACFGIAGPVVGWRCETTNLPWVVDTFNVRTHLNLEHVWLLNDLEALGYSIPVLESTELVTLQPGRAQRGNAALLAAGTGLGESFLFWNGRYHVPVPSEGGHSDFAPRNEWEIELLRFLAERYGHVSYERILSGPGIVDLFDFIAFRGERPAEPVRIARDSGQDPAPAIATAGLDRSCPVSVQVLDRFVEIYGAEAGNMALKALSVAGVFIGGGIAPKLLPRLLDGGFLRGFLDKGRFRGLLEQMPVHIIQNQQAGMLGAARYAALQSQV